MLCIGSLRVYPHSLGHFDLIQEFPASSILKVRDVPCYVLIQIKGTVACAPLHPKGSDRLHGIRDALATLHHAFDAQLAHLADSC